MWRHIEAHERLYLKVTATYATEWNYNVLYVYVCAKQQLCDDVILYKQ